MDEVYSRDPSVVPIASFSSELASTSGKAHRGHQLPPVVVPLPLPTPTRESSGTTTSTSSVPSPPDGTQRRRHEESASVTRILKVHLLDIERFCAITAEENSIMEKFQSSLSDFQ
ncbi:uncharacterized protein LOC125037223 isoform X2 [Penaeus chinensis]|uniref:uncharacterized protein LOC125037223 isoform X2 n=1 Tax=Penaeus chinensis TaxID=139456 RepID=UPI001FB705D9|nr:uncharacterized protein LOC125037223 isoform X2 [Penaeus chinensis]